MLPAGPLRQRRGPRTREGNKLRGLGQRPSCGEAAFPRLPIASLPNSASRTSLQRTGTGTGKSIKESDRGAINYCAHAHRLIRERGWRRPRRRVHPAKPTEGLRATKPNEYWHIDVTIIRLLDGSRVYLHAVIDNYSRRILAWKAALRLEPQATCAVLLEAAKNLPADGSPATVVADSGVENVNSEVDALLGLGRLRRVLAQVEVTFSNSMIEAWWRSLKHGWLYLNQLDTLAAVERLVGFYVQQHNTVMPHSAFQGQTPDEAYFGTGARVPEDLAAARRLAREARIASNKALKCEDCRPPPAQAPPPQGKPESPVIATVVESAGGAVPRAERSDTEFCHQPVSSTPLIEPDVRISRIRLSDRFHSNACDAGGSAVPPRQARDAVRRS